MTVRRHIVHVTGTLQAGGVQKLVLGLASAPSLRAHRHSVVCMFDVEGELRDEFAASHVSAVACPMIWPQKLPLLPYRAARWLWHRLEPSFSWRLASLLTELKADLVHTHVSHRVDLQTRGVLLKAQLPLVWTVHGLYAPTDREGIEWRRAVALARHSRCRITADSTPVVENLVARGLARTEDLKVVHAGADVDRFARLGERSLDWRARWRIPNDTILFGTCGRLVEAKAHDVLIEAVRILVDSRDDVHVVIAGSGPLQASLEERITRHGLQSRVHLLGYQADIPHFLRELDVFVLPSRSEGFPLALIEALAARLPCVATAVGGVDEMLGKAGGLVVDPDAPAQLADAMRKMMVPATRETYARTGAAIAEQFSYAACAKQFAQIYDELLT